MALKPRKQRKLTRAAASQTVTRRDFFDRVGITPAEFCEVVDSNPSIRGIIVGYVAERELREFFINDRRVLGLTKDDDHRSHRQ